MKTSSNNILQIFCYAATISLCALIGVHTSAYEVEFTDNAQALGLDYFGITFGQSWGDYNNDGYADLYVSNHGRETSILRNDGGLGFTNVNDQITADMTGDIHAGAWGDFDNDGDRDLLFVEGASGGVLESPNRLLVNTNGNFVDHASQWNLQQTFARSRTPGWLDWNQDGFLDVTFSNFPNNSGVAPSALYTRLSNTFEFENDNAGYNLLGSNTTATLVKTNTEQEPVLLANTVFGFPEGMYDMSQLPFTDLAQALTLPNISAGWDFAAADYDGDLDQEIFISRQFERSEVVQVDDSNLLATFIGITGIEQGISFAATGPITFSLGPSFRINPFVIEIGATGSNPESLEFTLDSNDPSTWGTPPHDIAITRNYIYYDPDEDLWHTDITNRLRYGMTISSTGTISNVQMSGVVNQDGGQLPFMLQQTPAGYTNIAAASGLTNTYPCMSISAADFDNDMDVDIYMSCAGSAASRDNVLLENDGTGFFTAVKGAAGASGSLIGRSDTAATADFNNDGFVDILVTNGFGTGPTAPGTTQLFVNGGNDNHWIHLDLEGVTVNRDGVGAWVVITAGGKAQSRLQDNGTKRFAQDDQRLHFGLGANTTIDEIVVRWPGGQVQTLENVAVDQILKIVQEVDTDSDGDGIDDALDNCSLVANPNQIDGDGDGFGNRCDTDLNNDQITNFVDVSLFAPLFLSTDAVADFNADGVVNFLDGAFFADYFLQPPGPSGSALPNATTSR